MARLQLIEIASPDDRPKSTAEKNLKWPPELLDDLEAEAARRTAALRLRAPDAPAVTTSEVIKDCCEFRMTLIRGLHLGYYHLRTLRPLYDEKSGVTSERKVTPKTSEAA
jgi:hypothetical protein